MLELLRDKLPFAVDDNFLSEAVQDCLLLYLHEADLYYLQPDGQQVACLLYTSDAADESVSV